MPTIDFLWDEWSDNVFQETDENNVVTTYFQRPEKYGEVLYHKAGSRFSFYHFDGNGSTRKLTNASQSTIKTFIISGFGELVASSGTGSTPFAYKGAAGYYTNPVTNDIYVRARTYEPTTGRWLSKDPLGFVDGPNLFGAYFVPGGHDPSGFMNLPNGVNYGRVCAVVMCDKSGLPIERWKRDARKAVEDPDLDILLCPEISCDEVGRFLRQRRCCTLYTFGHQGGDNGNPGGTVTFPNGPGDPVKFLPDANCGAWIKTGFWGCDACAINIVACGGTKDEHRKTRQDLANRTNCTVCGSISKISCGGIKDPGTGDPCTTVGDPTPGTPQIPWPHECSTPQPSRRGKPRPAVAID